MISSEMSAKVRIIGYNAWARPVGSGTKLQRQRCVSDVGRFLITNDAIQKVSEQGAAALSVCLGIGINDEDAVQAAILAMENIVDNSLSEAPAASSMIDEERHDSELFRVYAAILDAITDRILQPGKKLTESALCRQMACSRSTVRGALSLLAHDKIVDLQPNRGAFVHVPDAKETKDVYELRIALEEMVMDMLLALPDLPTRLQPLYEMIEQEKIAFEQGDRVTWVRLVNAFHVELVRLLDNAVLLKLMNSLCARSSLMIAVFDKPVRNNGSYEEHKEILDLLSEGKRARVCKMMRRHLGGCQERLNQQFN